MESTKRRRLKSFFKKLRSPYQLVIRQQDQEREVFKIKISRLRVILTVLIICALLIFVIISAVLATPLRQLLPGYLDTPDRIEVVQMRMQLDSITTASEKRDIYLQNIRTILQGDVVIDSVVPMDSVLIIPTDSLPVRTEREALFAAEFEEKEKYNLTQLQPLGVSQDVVFTAPVKGVISKNFDAKAPFYGVEVLCANRAVVSAPLSGTPVAITQTIHQGYQVVLQHSNGYVSIFRQVAKPLCRIGQAIPQGGLVGEMASKDDPFLSPILIYELWYRGEIQNPEDYIKF